MNETETAVLCLALTVTDCNAVILETLTPNHFADVRHRAIYTALQKTRKPDAALVVQQLEDSKTLEAAGGSAYVHSLKFFDASSSHLLDYLEVLRTSYRKAAYLETLRSLVRKTETFDGKLDDLLSEHEQVILKHTRSAGDFEETIQADRMAMGVQWVERAAERGNPLVGVSTGIKSLDDITLGYAPGAFNVFLGAPGVGKSALWLQSAIHVMRAHFNTAMIELEMSEAQLAMRQMAMASDINLTRIKTGRLQQHEWEWLGKVSQELASAKHDIFILNAKFQSWTDIKRWFRRKHSENGCKILWIDNLKLVQGLPNQDDLQRFNYVSRECKLLALELDITVNAIHHVTKIPDGRDITVNDAYGSSAFRQDADTIIVMNDVGNGVVRLEAGKNRDGQPNLTRDIYFNGAKQRFEEQYQGAEAN
jgi:replicative DNA helicase